MARLILGTFAKMVARQKKISENREQNTRKILKKAKQDYWMEKFENAQDSRKM